jgi:pimeloyl-ACP methyl ester carboxylesterase
MRGSSRHRRWGLAAICAIAAAVPAVVPVGAAAKGLDWQACGDAPNVECATQRVPLDYDKPSGKHIGIAVTRVTAADKAHRIGSLFINPGGPGFSYGGYLQGVGRDNFMADLNQRYDIVAIDPRGVDGSTGAIDCHVNQETQGIYRMPFPTPFTANIKAIAAESRAYGRRCLARNNEQILAHASSAETAHDMDVIRASVGDKKLNYLGFSYGTFLGTTYLKLFADRAGRVVLDGPIDADEYQSDPLKGSNEQTSAFERELGRFFQACARDQANCLGFGGDDPWDAYDQLIDRANTSPIPAPRYTPDPRPVDGDTINNAVITDLYAKQFWPEIAEALAEAQAGDASLFRFLSDEIAYGRDPETGAYDPGFDRFVAIYSAESIWPKKLAVYDREGDQAWSMFDHFYFNHGYLETGFGLWPVRAKDAYYGPYNLKKSTPTPLVVATTYDPATPYRGARKLVRTLDNARLLTMRGDGHTAYGGNSPCIDAAVNEYLIDGHLPPAGTSCKQDVPFAQPEAPSLSKSSSGAAALRARHRNLTRDSKPSLRSAR